MCTVQFNLNAFSEAQLLKDFRFFLPEISRIPDSLCRSGIAKQELSKRNTLIACVITLYRLSTTPRWNECEIKFGMHWSKLSEIIWENMELLNSKFSHLLKLHPEFLSQHREMYASTIESPGAPLDSRVRFADWTKIRISRSGRRKMNQRFCFSGLEVFHCLT